MRLDDTCAVAARILLNRLEVGLPLAEAAVGVLLAGLLPPEGDGKKLVAVLREASGAAPFTLRAYCISPPTRVESSTFTSGCSVPS